MREYVIVDIFLGVKPVFGVRGFIGVNYEQLGKDGSNPSHRSPPASKRSTRPSDSKTKRVNENRGIGNCHKWEGNYIDGDRGNSKTF